MTAKSTAVRYHLPSKSSIEIRSHQAQGLGTTVLTPYGRYLQVVKEVKVLVKFIFPPKHLMLCTRCKAKGT